MVDDILEPFNKKSLKEKALINLKKAKANEKEKLENGAKFKRVNERTLTLEK